jgi:hypothetical protein
MWPVETKELANPGLGSRQLFAYVSIKMRLQQKDFLKVVRTFLVEQYLCKME